MRARAASTSLFAEARPARAVWSWLVVVVVVMGTEVRAPEAVAFALAKSASALRTATS